MDSLRLKFVDFWLGFDPYNNYFFSLLSLSYHVEISDEPDLIIYSCYGFNYLKYRCIRIFYTAENVRPDYTGCDFAISFDYSQDPRHYRLPLYALYLDNEQMIKLTEDTPAHRALSIWRAKKKFCCIVVSNGNSKTRLEFFDKLSGYRTIDSGGKIKNNVGGPVADKLSFIKDYRFVISFENDSYPGYTTEKIVEAYKAECIPIYWGNPLIEREFSPETFLQLSGSKAQEELMREVIHVDQNEELAVAMLMKPKFTNGAIPLELNKELLTRFFQRIIQNMENRAPVATSWKRHLHYTIIKIKYYESFVIGLSKRIVAQFLNRNF